MKKILQRVSSFVLALSMVAIPLTANAQHNGGARQGHSSGVQSHNSGAQSHNSGAQSRPSGSNARPSGSSARQAVSSARPAVSNARPSTNNNRPAVLNNRPSSGNSNQTVNNATGTHRGSGNGTNYNTGNQRPGNNGGNNGNVGNQRPGNNGGSFGRPGNNGGNFGRPGGNINRPPHHGADFVPRIPFFGHYHRPVPPRTWRPGIYGPTFGSILGITIGTTLDLTLNALLNSGYAVSSYGDDVIYLTDVQQMNYYWPDAALYYNGGRLYGSQFTYATSYYDMSRYNSLYNAFCRQYGNPVSYGNQGGVISASWFGANNRYVTLEFNSSYGNNYYTTLSFGM